MTSYYVESHRSSRKHHVPAIVRRYPVHRTPVVVPVPKPASTGPTKTSAEQTSKKEPKAKEKEKEPKEKAKENLKEEPNDKSKEAEPKEKTEEKAASEPAPVWSTWQPLEGGQWDGYWRAKANDGSGWTYQFTRDFKTIWEQKPAEPETSPSSSKAPTTTAGEPVLFMKPTAAFTTTPPHFPLDTLSSTAASYAVDDSDVVFASYGDVAVSTMDSDLYGLTLDTHSYGHIIHHQQEEQDGQHYVIATTTSSSSEKEATCTTTTPGTRDKKKSRHHHVGHRRRETHHGSHTRPKQAHHNSYSLGEIVSGEKSKKFDSNAIVENWQFG